MEIGPTENQRAISTEAAVRRLRADPNFAELVRDTYLDEDVLSAANRFASSGEWIAITELLGERVRGATVVDLGAGNGMASRAFVLAGAAQVYAIEPDASPEIGRDAIARTCRNLPVAIVDAVAERLPLPNGCATIVFARQVLHHTRDLEQSLRECARVLRSGGILVACREHIANSPEELRTFLHGHAIHQLTGGENAYSLKQYVNATTGAGLILEKWIGQWESVINLHPTVSSTAEIAGLPARLLREKFGWLGTIACAVPGVTALARRRLMRFRPGELCSFLARKP